MIHVGVGVDYSLVYKVLEYLLDELARDRMRVEAASIEDKDTQREVLECNVHTALYLLIIMCKVRKTTKYSKNVILHCTLASVCA